jgi:hypothetical protein
MAKAEIRRAAARMRTAPGFSATHPCAREPRRPEPHYRRLDFHLRPARYVAPEPPHRTRDWAQCQWVPPGPLPPEPERRDAPPVPSFKRAAAQVGETYFMQADTKDMDCGLEPEVIPDAYPDFARRYTADGGVEFTCKDHDRSPAVWLIKIIFWLAAMGGTGWYAWAASPYPMKLATAAPLTFNIIGLFVMAILYAAILAKPVELYRSVEVRPDRLILDGTEEFYRDTFECGWPIFQPDGEGEAAGAKLVGIYGTRFVEFLTVVRFDEGDRMPEVFSVNLTAAFEQLWVQPGSRCMGPVQIGHDAVAGDKKSTSATRRS